MEILALIPARSGSKGIPKKNIRSFNGKPLIAYTIEAARLSRYINKIVVSTDSEEISNIAKELGAEVPFLRPPKLSDDKSPTIDTVLHCLDFLKTSENYVPDFVCLLQCTSPLRKSTQIDDAVELLIDSEKNSLISICENDRPPFWMRVINDGRLCELSGASKTYTRRQDIPKTYRFNGGIYITKTNALLETKLLHDNDSVPFIMDKLSSIDIDDEIDFTIAEFLYKKYFAEDY